MALYPNGNAVLTFLAGDRHVVEGTWFGCQDANLLELEIDRLNDRPAEGTGQLVLHRNGEVHAVEIEGRSDASKGNFRIDYLPAGHEDERQAGRHAINSTEIGIGRYESRASNAILNRAKIQLGANGGASLAFTGRDTYSFTGTWTPVRDGIAQVDITRMMGRIAVNGRATVQYRGDHVDSVQLSGSSRQRGPFQLNFQSGQAPQEPPVRRSWKFRLGDLF